MSLGFPTSTMAGIDEDSPEQNAARVAPVSVFRE